MTRLIIVRHGDTFSAAEPPRRIGARCDLPLVASGIAQAKRLGTWFAEQDIIFSTALSSDLSRTLTTAALILKRVPSPPMVQTADWLTEIDHGPDEGQPERLVTERLGSAALSLWDTASIPPPDWIVDARQRLADWGRMLDAPPQGDTLLVTSNGAARFALLALSPPDYRPPKLRTGAYGVLEKGERPGSSNWKVTAWNVRPS